MTHFTASDQSVLEPGTYDAEFTRLVETPEPGPFGPTVDVFFNVITEDGPTEISGRATNPQKLTKATKLRGWLEALLGRPMTTGEAIDPSTLSGAKVQLTLGVKTTEVGEFNRIIAIRPHANAAGGGDDTKRHFDPEYEAWRAARRADDGSGPPTEARPASARESDASTDDLPF